MCKWFTTLQNSNIQIVRTSKWFWNFSDISKFYKSVSPHLELFKADFDLENIKQSWLSGQNIGLHAPSPWFKPQQPLPKKKDIFMHLREVYYYIYILVSTEKMKTPLFTFYNFYNFWKIIKIIKSQRFMKSCKIATFQNNIHTTIFI